MHRYCATIVQGCWFQGLASGSPLIFNGAITEGASSGLRCLTRSIAIRLWSTDPRLAGNAGSDPFQGRICAIESANIPPLRFRNSGESSRCNWRSLEIVFQNLNPASPSAIASSITSATGGPSPLCQYLSWCARIAAIAGCGLEPFGSIILISVTFDSTKSACFQAAEFQRILARKLYSLAGN